MKDKLKKLLAAKQEQRKNLNNALIESDSKEERAEIGKTLEALAAEIAEVEEMLAEVDDPADQPAAGENTDERGMNIMQTMEMRTSKPEKKKIPPSNDVLGTFRKQMAADPTKKLRNSI